MHPSNVFTISIAFFLWATQAVVAQQFSGQEKSQQDPHQEAIVDCAKTGVRSAKSKTFTSPDHKSSAYVETIAEALQEGGCVNESRLYVKFDGESAFRLVVLQSPQEMQLGNKFIFIDWSADSRYLLFERMLFQYGSDAPPRIEPRLYAIHGHYLISPDLDRVDATVQNRECLLYLRPVGFSSAQSIAIEEEVRPYFDPAESAPRDAKCPNRTTLWEVPFAGNGKIRQLPGNYKIQRFAETQVPQ
jgi:hypothetical protein